MRAIFFFLGMGLVIAGISSIQASPPDTLNATAQFGGVAISWFRLWLGTIALALVILIFVFGSYRRALHGKASEVWYISEIIVGGIAGLLIYFTIDRSHVYIDSCYYLGSYALDNFCIKPWIYFLAYALASTPVVLGLLGLIHAVLVSSKGITQRIASIRFVEMPHRTLQSSSELDGYAIRTPPIVIGGVIGFFPAGFRQ